MLLFDWVMHGLLGIVVMLVYSPLLLLSTLNILVSMILSMLQDLLELTDKGLNKVARAVGYTWLMERNTGAMEDIAESFRDLKTQAKVTTPKKGFDTDVS